MFQGRLSKKLVFCIMLISGVFTLLSTSYTVYHDYRNRISALEQQVKDIVDSYEQPLGVAIYKSQTLIVTLILETFRGLSDEYLAAAKDSDGKNVMTVANIEQDEIMGKMNALGTRNNYFTYKKEIDFGLSKYVTNGEVVVIEGYVGSIEVTVSTEHVKREIIGNIKTILVAQFIKTLIVSLFILFLIDKLILSRQIRIVNWLREFSKNQSIDPLQLRKTIHPDELDDMTYVINDMGSKIVSHQKSLENTVNDRTRELVVKNTELENAQKELHLMLHSKSLALNHIEETLSTALWETDIFGNIISMSESLDKNVLRTDSGTNVLRLSEVVSLPRSKNKDSFDKVLKGIFDSREPFTIHDTEIKNSFGNRISIRLDGRPKIIDGAFTGYNGTITDISSEKKLRMLAYSDGLTGLANRLALEHHFEKTQQRAKRLNFSNGIMALDLDFFKSINDNYGHAVGDDVLKAVALSLSDCVREEDCVARIGGEEFVVLVQGVTLEGLITLAERINESVRSLRPSSLPIERKITVSIGLTIVALNEQLSDALKRADDFLYMSKKNGRDTVSYDSK
ncbi:diguanylate cyclase (GGDEF) domain-containing protein [Arsukibacterium tuosuense]|uniref:diguanylate cyclase n=2 Tax=Arsukibacterium tuosuense TaxID=1323745 RepID=A0A285IDB3_9GAMM|nr:diguanylate cyclase (GGDEF) domain-containing protein [Arsukibacterium tuosuense]